MWRFVRGARTSCIHGFLVPGEVMASAERLVPLVTLGEKLFLRGDEPPVRGMMGVVPSLDILGDGSEGLAFASRGARAARCFVGEEGIVGMEDVKLEIWGSRGGLGLVLGEDSRVSMREEGGLYLRSGRLVLYISVVWETHMWLMGKSSPVPSRLVWSCRANTNSDPFDGPDWGWYGECARLSAATAAIYLSRKKYETNSSINNFSRIILLHLFTACTLS